MKKNTENFINFLGWVATIILIIVLITEVIIPAYNSYTVSCEIERNSDTELIILGSATYNHSTQEIEVKISEGLSDGKRLETIKHELIHVDQFKRGFIPTCNTPLLVIISEMEAYIGEELPNPIFEFIYGVDLSDY